MTIFELVDALSVSIDPFVLLIKNKVALSRRRNFHRNKVINLVCVKTELAESKVIMVVVMCD
jgi:hypothetical protein